MTITLNEHDWAEDMIAGRTLGKKPFETLTRVARYYLDGGMPRREVRKRLDAFLLQCDPSASLPKWCDTADAALARASRRHAVNIDEIVISTQEMSRIEKLDSKQLRRLAFTLLCLSKYWDAVNEDDRHWVNSPDSDIMRMANINTSISRQSMMYHRLNQEGMIVFSRKVSNTNVRVCFAEDGVPALAVRDFRNLGYQYLKYCGEPFFFCANCGIVTRYKDPKNGKKQKYCPDCAAKIALQQRINSVMRRRDIASSKTTEAQNQIC